MFINGKTHRNAEIDYRKGKWSGYTWTRMSKFFEGEKYSVSKVIEPEDVKQGNLDNTQLMACLSGMAAQDVSKYMAMKEDGKKVSKIKKEIVDDMRGIGTVLLTKKINKAGIYALRLYINGRERTVVVDDYMPTKLNKHGQVSLAFAKSSKGDNEVWMMLIEKAYAKICGSYEAAEKSIQGPCQGIIAQSHQATANHTVSHNCASIHGDEVQKTGYGT